ncbi:MAG: CvpA family protein [Gammaproteobacteria bacterium]|nr:CvpA family protein [Gammaproteobacteria bacterium]
MSDFNYWDIGFAVLLLISTYRGWTKGAVIDTIATVVLLVAVIGGLIFGTEVGNLILGASEVDQNPWALPLGFVIVFIVMTLVGAFVRKGIDSALAESAMRPADRSIGLLLGVVRGLLVILLIIACMLRWYPDSPALIHSFSFDLLQPFIDDVSKFVDLLVR